MLQRPQNIVRSLTAMTSACFIGAARIVYNPHQQGDNRGRPPDRLLNDVAKEIVSDWRRLGIDLGLSRATIANIERLPNKDEQDKAFEMLTSWKQKLRNGEDGFRLLVASLSKWERNDLVEMVENACLEMPVVNRDDLAARIRGMLRSKYCGHRIVTTSSNGEVKFELPNIFTPLELTKKAVVSTRLGAHMELLDLRNSDGDMYKQILVRGPMGCGKTVLLKAISQDWSKQNANLSSSASMYELMFSIDLRDVSEAEDLADHVFKQLLPDDITDLSSDSLRSYLEDPEKQSRVAVLLDGLDQLTCCGNKLSSKVVPEYFYKLITKKVLRESLVIVASRTLTKKLPDSYQIVDVGGLSKEAVTTYVEKFFQGDSAKAHYLQDVLVSYSPDLRDFSTSPNIACALCELLNSKGERGFPTKLTSLYDKIFEDMMRQYQSDICLHGNGPIRYLAKSVLKSMDLADVFPTFHNPVPVRDEQLGRFFHDIGKVALRGLLAHRENQDFEESDFGRDTLAIARSVGLLVKGDETSAVIRFCHQSMQEYCASKYCQSLAASKPTKFRKKLLEKDSLVDLVNLYRFCCGGSGESSDLVMKLVVPCLAQKEVAVGSCLEGRVALACLTEFHSDDFLRHLVGFLTKEGSIKVEYSFSGSCLLRDLCSVLATAHGRKEFRHNLESVHTLDVSCRMNTGCIRRIAEMVRQLRHLQTVSVVDNSNQIPFQLDTALNGERVALHPVSELSSSLRRHHLSKLTVINCGLDSRCLASVLSQLPDLQSLDLSNNPGIIWSRLRMTAQPPRLTTLTLRQCGINKDQVGSFVQFLQQQPDLVELDIDRNDLDTSGLGLILDALCDMGKLQIVSAERRRSDGMLLPHDETVRMLRRCSTLKALNVSRWEPMDEDAGAEMLEAASNLDDFQALIFDERSVIVDELGNVATSQALIVIQP
ncbi:uncharacterized protein LOC119725187 [Patiria miniata]|uniref:Uncharacterized protein n=1 Tax=Patiria miniata TaxID=46514 RepID=A0A913ZN51_PATMI|nr:uncharacterized protein LOC119725187 [Patiria miniata]